MVNLCCVMRTIKREAAGTVDAKGESAGGRFARTRPPEQQNLSQEELDNLFGKADIPVPWPTKKRQITVRCHPLQSWSLPKDQAAFKVKKDNKTGLWAADEFLYGDPDLRDLECITHEDFESEGSEQEIGAYTAKVFAKLINQGVMSPKSGPQMLAAQMGVTEAAIFLGMQGNWWTESEIPNPATNSIDTSAIEECKGYYRRWNKSSIMPHFYEKYLTSKEMYPVGGEVWYHLDNFQKAFRQAQRELERRMIGKKLAYDWRSCREYQLVWALSRQTATQELGHRARDEFSALLSASAKLSQGVAQQKTHFASLPAPDARLAESALQAFLGKGDDLTGGHDGMALKRYIDNSESEHTSHIFEPSGTAIAGFSEDGDLADRLDQETDEIIPSELEMNKMSRAQANKMFMSMPRIRIFQSDDHLEPKFGDLMLGRRAVSNKIVPDNRDLGYLNYLQEEYFQEHAAYNRYHDNRDLCSKSWGASFGGLQQGEYSNNKDIPAIHEGDVWTERHFEHAPTGIGRNHQRVAMLPSHPEVDRVPLALYAMASYDKNSEARQKAEQFLLENNYQPFAAMLLNRSISELNTHLDNFEINYWQPKRIEDHRMLIVRACRAWNELEDDDPRWYSKKGGRLDPEMLLRKAQQASVRAEKTLYADQDEIK